MNVPETMKGVRISEGGGPEVLVVEEMPTPQPGPGEILIRIGAAGVNRPDVLQRMGLYPPPPDASPLPGLEAAGEVAATGEGASRFVIGGKVTALLAGGGYAEYALVDERHALPVPAGLDILQAAALPETYFTVWHNVFQRGELKEGETFLVHGGSSGIGTTAIQLAKAFGATVFATAGTADKCRACLDLGADLAIDYKKQDFVEEVKKATGKHGADVILDMVGGDYIPRNYNAAAPDGRIVQIAFLGGSKVEVDFTKLMLKRLTHTGSTLRARDADFKAALAAELQKYVWPLLEAGKIAPVMDQTFGLDGVIEAHRRIDGGEHIGKVMLTTG